MEPDLFPLTKFSSFEAHLAKESAKARRYGRRFSVLVFELRPIRRSGGTDVGASLQKVAPAILRTLRDADLAAFRGDELWLLLPETDRLGAHMLHQRAVSLAGSLGDSFLCGGSAAFPEDVGAGPSLVALARRRLDDEAARSLGALRLEGIGFWAALEKCLSSELGEASSTRRGVLHPASFRTIVAETARAVSRGSDARSFLFLCGTDGDVCNFTESLPDRDLEARIFTCGAEGALFHPSIRAIPAGENGRGWEVLLYLSGRRSYGWIRRVEGAGLHTADVALVRKLVASFRERYDHSRWEG